MAPMTGTHQEPTALQVLLGYDAETGEYREASRLRRLAQLAIIEDRGISQGEVGRRVGLSRNAINMYFKGTLTMGRTAGPPVGAPSNRPNRRRKRAEAAANAEARREAREDEVERAIEAISAERGIVIPLAGDYIPEVMTRELMKAPA